MSDREFRETLAKLQTLIAINDMKLMANPKPYLEDMSKRCSQLLNVLEKVEYALSPDFVYDVWNESCDKEMIKEPRDLSGGALFRCEEALRILREYKYL